MFETDARHLSDHLSGPDSLHAVKIFGARQGKQTRRALVGRRVHPVRRIRDTGEENHDAQQGSCLFLHVLFR